MKVVVFGAAGWTGRAVLASLAGKHEVRAVLRAPESWDKWRDIDGEWDGGEVVYGDLKLYPVIAPPLIIVGSMMMTSVKSIRWDDYTESVPAFLTMIIMPLTFSITEGIAFGFISYALLKLLSGRGKEANALIYVFAALFVLRYAFMV